MDKVPIVIIVPLFGRPQTLHTFLSTYTAMVEEGENLDLVIVNFEDGNVDSTRNLKNEVEPIQKRISRSISILSASGPFSRGKGLQIGGLAQVNNDLLFFCDIDIAFNAETLRRIRYHTVPVSIPHPHHTLKRVV